MAAEPTLSIEIPSSPPIPPRTALPTQIGRFAAVGAVSTVVHLGLFTVLHLAWPSQVANVVALVLATIVNTALNRRWTFRVAGGGSWRHQVQGLVVFLLTWGATSGGLAVLDVLWPSADTAVTLCALVAATGISTVVRFLAMRAWIFRTEAP